MAIGVTEQDGRAVAPGVTEQDGRAEATGVTVRQCGHLCDKARW